MRHEKPELSEKNLYHLSRHRYYELKHFCFQYPEWKKNIALASGWEAHGDDIGGIVRGNILLTRPNAVPLYEHTIRSALN